MVSFFRKKSNVSAMKYIYAKEVLCKHNRFPSNQRFRKEKLFVVRWTDLGEDLSIFRMPAIKSQSKKNLDTLFIAF